MQLTPHCLRLPAGPLSSSCLAADFLKPLPVRPLSSSLVVEAPMPGVWPQSSPRLAAFWPVPPYRPTWTRRKRHYGVRLLRWSGNTPRSSSGGSGVSSNGLLITFGLGMRPCCEVNSLHHLHLRHRTWGAEGRDQPKRSWRSCGCHPGDVPCGTCGGLTLRPSCVRGPARL